MLLPFATKWAVLVDGSIGLRLIDEQAQFRKATQDGFASIERVFYERNPHLANEDEQWGRVATIRPSIVRLWRQDRVSFWIGAGLGLESEYGRWRFRRVREVFDTEGNVVGRENEADLYGTLIRDEEFTAGKNWNHSMAMIGRFGFAIGLTPRMVMRAGYSCVMTYLDAPLSGVVELGVGYRF